MYRYVVKRVLLIIPILFGVTFLVFFIMNITPGDPGRLILGISAKQEAVDALNESLGYNKPVMVRFWDYINGIVTKFSFGNSYETGRSVTKTLMANFPTTFKLCMLGTALYVLIGIPLGVLSAVKQYSFADNILRVSAMVLAAVPGFWLSLLGLLFFCLKLGWFPSNGIDTWKHYVMPVVLFSITPAAHLMRLTRTIMLESIRQDFVRTVRAKGAPESTVIWQHVFKNAMLPIIMTVGISFGAMMGGSVMMETIFSLPGLGFLVLAAMRSKDLPIVMGCTIFLSTIFCVMVLLVDIVSAYTDPRVKAKYTS